MDEERAQLEKIDSQVCTMLHVNVSGGREDALFACTANERESESVCVRESK